MIKNHVTPQKCQKYKIFTIIGKCWKLWQILYAKITSYPAFWNIACLFRSCTCWYASISRFLGCLESLVLIPPFETKMTFFAWIDEQEQLLMIDLQSFILSWTQISLLNYDEKGSLEWNTMCACWTWKLQKYWGRPTS